MKTLKTLFISKPSYMKWGNARLSNLTGLKIKTIESFKKKPEFKELKRNYNISLKTSKINA